MNPRLRFKREDGTDYPDWEEKNLGEVAKISTGYAFKNSDYCKNGEFLVITNANIQDNDYQVLNNVGNRINLLDKYSKYILNKNDILVTMDGTVGRVAKVCDDKMLLAQRVGRVVSSSIYNEYLFQFLSSNIFYTEMKNNAKGAMIAHISLRDIENCPVFLPCLEEQKKIADFLSDIDEVILASNQEVKKLQELKKGAMQKIFSQKVRFKRDDGTDYPDWEEKKLTDYLEFKNGINANRDSFGTGIKLISVSDILNNDYITYDVIRNKINIDEKTKQLYEVNYGDILFQRCSETLEEAGSANVYLDTQKAVFGGFVIRGKKIGEYNPIFFNHLLKSSSVRMEIKKKAQGAQHINIGQDLLSTIFFFIPCLEEQEKIGDFLSDFDEAISLAKQEFEKWKLLKKGILQQMFV